MSKVASIAIPKDSPFIAAARLGRCGHVLLSLGLVHHWLPRHLATLAEGVLIQHGHTRLMFGNDISMETSSSKEIMVFANHHIT
jgi:hypothetical protein